VFLSGQALNDLAVAATFLRDEGAVQRVLIVDLDVHQVRVLHGRIREHVDFFCQSVLWRSVLLRREADLFFNVI
jgi:hypothetical protein